MSPPAEDNSPQTGRATRPPGWPSPLPRAHITDGGILLLHRGVGDTIGVLSQIAEVLRQRNLTLTTVTGVLTR